MRGLTLFDPAFLAISQFDPDFRSWSAAVEATGATFGPSPETAAANKLLISNQIFAGSKADPSPVSGVSNWQALKVFGLTVGPSTFAGLVPIKGLPTFLNQVAGDYNRLTGLLGDLVNKGISSNRSQSADHQDNWGAFVYLTQSGTASGAQRYIGANNANAGRSIYLADGRVACRGGLFAPSPSLGSSASIGIVGMSRHLAGSFVARRGGAQQTITAASLAPTPEATTFMIDLLTPNTSIDGRSAAYGTGEAINLAALEVRVAAVVAGLV